MKRQEKGEKRKEMKMENIYWVCRGMVTLHLRKTKLIWTKTVRREIKRRKKEPKLKEKKPK